ncbi:MAG TPA: hypothetical protein VM187_17005, partial [Niastella sp.]|nr:hypothetical protein [Niastella sp.]
DFKSFTHNAYDVAGTKLTSFSTSKNGIVVAAGTALAPVIYYSIDFGGSWNSLALTTASFSPAISTTGFNTTELVDAAYIDTNYLMLAYQQKSTTNADSRKYYKLNLTTKIATRVSFFDDAYYQVNVKFVDKKTGYALLYKNSTYSSYIAKTRDTGRTWSVPVAITDRVLAVLQTGVKGNLCAMENFGNAYVSADSGVTWKKPATELKLTSAHMVNQHIIYGVTQESLVKSTDTGVTWNTVANTATYEYINMKRLHFQDELNGIMYGGQKLYITADGGVTWKVLLYPYEYVISDN